MKQITSVRVFRLAGRILVHELERLSFFIESALNLVLKIEFHIFLSTNAGTLRLMGILEI